MTRALVRLFWLFALLLPAAGAIAATDAATAERLLRLSGLDQQIEGVGRQLRSGFREGLLNGAAREATATEQQRLERVVDSVVTADRLRTATRDALARGFDAQYLPALQRWFDSPLGQRIARAEVDAGMDDAAIEQTMKRGTALLRKGGPERRKLITALVDAIRADQFLAQLTIDIAQSVERGIASTTADRWSKPMPGTSALVEQQREQLREQQRRQLTAEARPMLIASYAEIYAAIDNADLRRYLALLKSPAGSHFNAASMAAIGAALVTTTNELGRQLPDIRDQVNT